MRLRGLMFGIAASCAGVPGCSDHDVCDPDVPNTICTLEAQLDRPFGIELAGGKLYVADSYNNRVRVVNLGC